MKLIPYCQNRNSKTANKAYTTMPPKALAQSQCTAAQAYMRPLGEKNKKYENKLE